MNSKEALEKLYLGLEDYDTQAKCYELVYKDLERLEKLEKALDILKTKRVEISFLLCSKDLEDYEDYCGILDVYFPTISNYEFLLLKEVLGND